MPARKAGKKKRGTRGKASKASLHSSGELAKKIRHKIAQHSAQVFHPSTPTHHIETSPQLTRDTRFNNFVNSSTGIAGLDEHLSGGFPKGSVVLLSGGSGSGKTIVSFQWLFEGIKNNENGVYITLTESLYKSVKDLETLGFYDRDAIEQQRVRIVDLREYLDAKGYSKEGVLNYIEKIVKETNAKRLCIDSITAIAYNLGDKAKIRQFIFQLGKILSTLGCTTILTSEITAENQYSVFGVEEFISDAIIHLHLKRVKNEYLRMMNIIKVRGRQFKTEEVYFKISEQGITVFPKVFLPLTYSSGTQRVSTGNPMLDRLIHGGVFRGSSTLLVGSTGAGKSLLSTQFIMEGLKKGESCLYAGFEESRDQIVRNAASFGWDFEKYEKNGLLTLRCVYPNEKFIDEHLVEIKEIIEQKKIQRCVVDSLSSISTSFWEDAFVNFAKRLNGFVKSKNVTSFFTSASSSLIGSVTLTDKNLSTMTDNIIMLRYVELGGELHHVMNVVKVRGSGHSKGLRTYEITDKGIIIGHELSGYEGILSGVTRKVSRSTDELLEAEFRRFIGPLAPSIYTELKNKGLSKDNVAHYIDELVGDGILPADSASMFKQSVLSILGGKTSQAQQDKKEDKTPKKEEPSFLGRLLYGD